MRATLALLLLLLLLFTYLLLCVCVSVYVIETGYHVFHEAYVHLYIVQYARSLGEHPNNLRAHIVCLRGDERVNF